MFDSKNFNEEQFEAHQENANKKSEEFISSLPPEAQAKARKIRELATELNKLGTPYYLFIESPICPQARCGSMFWPLQFNNLIEVANPSTPEGKNINEMFNAQFLSAVFATFVAATVSRGDDAFGHFISVLNYALRITHPEIEQDNLNPHDALYKSMNERWGLELENPYK